MTFNTLRPRQNGRYFPDDIFKFNFLNDVRTWIKISQKYVAKDNIPASVQIMAWRRPGDKPLSEPMMVSLLTHTCVTRPQWVKQMVTELGVLGRREESMGTEQFVMETFSALLGPLWGESIGDRRIPLTNASDVEFWCFLWFDLRLNKRLSKQSRRLWFETTLRSLWRHCNVILWRQSIPRYFARNRPLFRILFSDQLEYIRDYQYQKQPKGKNTYNLKRGAKMESRGEIFLRDKVLFYFA